MSASFGMPGQTEHPDVTAALERAIASAKQNGRLVSMASSPTSVGHWAAKGVELFFCASDILCMRVGAAGVIEQCRTSVETV